MSFSKDDIRVCNWGAGGEKYENLMAKSVNKKKKVLFHRDKHQFPLLKFFSFHFPTVMIFDNFCPLYSLIGWDGTFFQKLQRSRSARGGSSLGFACNFSSRSRALRGHGECWSPRQSFSTISSTGHVTVCGAGWGGAPACSSALINGTGNSLQAGPVQHWCLYPEAR